MCIRDRDRIIISSAKDADLAALVHLAMQLGVPVEERGQDILPYRAITIIAHRGRDAAEQALL